MPLTGRRNLPRRWSNPFNAGPQYRHPKEEKKLQRPDVEEMVTQRGTKRGREEEETKCVRDAGCTLFLFKFKAGVFLSIHVKCWVHQQH